jgi:hypothetical protein
VPDAISTIGCAPERPPLASSANGRGHTLLLTGTFVIAAFAKTPHVFLAPRLWAEEGTFYFSAMQSLDVVDSMLLVVRANYQFLLNLIVAIATLVPSAWAAHVSTYASFSVAVFVAYLIACFARAFALPTYVSMLLGGVWALLPPTYEVFATATNVQWVCSVSLLVICALPLHGRPKWQRAGVYAWAVACGLTGVASCVLTPGFLLRGMVYRSRPHLMIGLLLAVCSLVQIWVLTRHEMAGRPFGRDLDLLLLPTVLQTMLAPLIGVAFVNEIGAAILSPGAPAIAWRLCVLAAAVSVVVFLVFAARGYDRERRIAFTVLLALWFTVSLVNTFGAFGDPRALQSGWSGGRYFLLGAVAFSLLLALATGAAARPLRIVAGLALSLMFAVGAANALLPAPWKTFITRGGASWAEEVARCGAQRPCRVEIWPKGWHADLVR